MIKFSIIIPTYNSEKYIQEAIKSIQDNNYSNLEIIIVDNGSNDNTVQLINRLKREDNRLKFKQISYPSTGTSRNIGISMATGEYLLFLDSDDLISPNALSRINNIIKTTDSDFIIFQNRIFGDSIKGSLTGERYGNAIYNMGTMVWNKAISLSIAKQVYFPEGTLFEDVAYSAQCYLRAHKPVVVKDFLYFYRARENSIVHTKQSPSQRLDILDGFELLMDDLRNKKLHNGADWVLQCQILINCIVIDHIRSIMVEWGINVESKKSILQLRSFLLKVNKELRKNLFLNNKFPGHYKVWLFLIKFKKLNTASFLLLLKNVRYK